MRERERDRWPGLVLSSMHAKHTRVSAYTVDLLALVFDSWWEHSRMCEIAAVDVRPSPDGQARSARG